MPQRRRDTETRQAELVDAALEVIARQGVAALTTRSLAEAVGLTTGAIFRHFETLDALLSAVARRVEAVLDDTYPPPGLPPVERLARFVEARSTAVGSRRGVLQLMLSEQFRLALPAADAARLTRAVKRTKAFIAEALAEGQADGSVRGDVPAAALGPIVLGTIQALARSAQQGPVPEATAVAAGLFTLLRPPAATRGHHPRKKP
jgi:AcrR family transcriptional regulator